MEQDLNKAEKLIQKIIRNMKVGELKYIVQVSHTERSHGLFFDAWIEAAKDGMKPLQWRETTMKKLIADLEGAVKSVDDKQVNIQYFQGDMERLQREIDADKEMIEKLQNPES